MATLATWKTSELDGQQFPLWTNGVAAVLISASCLCIPGLAVHHVLKKGSIQVITVRPLCWYNIGCFQAACKPTSHWGPYKAENRKNTRYEDRKEYIIDPSDYKEYNRSGQHLLDSQQSFP